MGNRERPSWKRETLHNPDFNRVQFDTVKNEAGANRFVMTPTKWIEQMNAIGIVSKSGRYGGGTFAHSDIAMSFATWLSPEFQLYIMKDYRRLKSDENSRLSLNWNLNRELSKLNYRIHTDAIKENLLPNELTLQQKSFVYADEADLLNVALFGKTAKEGESLPLATASKSVFRYPFCGGHPRNAPVLPHGFDLLRKIQKHKKWKIVDFPNPCGNIKNWVKLQQFLEVNTLLRKIRKLEMFL